MSKTLAVLSPKGGAGKTTLSTNLACALERLSRSVVLIDSDTQGTARDWAASAPSDGAIPLVVGVDRAASLEREVRKLGASYDLIVIDGSAHVKDMDAEALRVADLVLIPVQPSNADIWGAYPLVELVKERRRVVGRPEARWVVSRQITGTNLAAEVAGALEETGVLVLPRRTTQRIAYAEALSAGLSVLDYEVGGKAAAEVRAIADEVLDLLEEL